MSVILKERYCTRGSLIKFRLKVSFLKGDGWGSVKKVGSYQRIMKIPDDVVNKFHFNYNYVNLK